eukprot:Opistho-2@81792
MSVIPKEAIRLAAESVGISQLDDKVMTVLIPDVEYRLREIVQDALKFMKHSKRTRLSTEDINSALRVKNIDPVYGNVAPEPVVFKGVTGPSGRAETYFAEDEEIDLASIINAPLPKVPVDVSFTAHWLAIEGVQPAIAENPPVCMEPKPAAVGGRPQPADKAVAAALAVATGLAEAGKTADVRPLVRHVLSRELQVYYERITQALLDTAGPDEPRQAALECLKTDPGLHQLLPYFCQFVLEKVTERLRDLPVLILLMRAVQALFANQSLFLEPYLHQIMPAILTCLVGKLGLRQMEDHWSLRDLAANTVETICRKYGDKYDTLQRRIAKTLSGAMKDDKPLGVRYGAIVGLSALGPEAVRELVLPHVQSIAESLDDRNPDAYHVRKALLDAVAKMIRHDERNGSTNTRPDYRAMYGVFGEWLQSHLAPVGGNTIVLHVPPSL